MPMYEFQCAAGHTTEDLRPMDCKTIVCSTCWDLMKLGQLRVPFYGDGVDLTATRILSPTRTNFEFADKRRKRSIE